MNDTNTELEELEKLVARIVAHQEAIGFENKDKEYVKMYSQYLGSERTWRYRLKVQNYETVNISRALTKLRKMVAELEGGGVGLDEMWEEMPCYQEFRKRFARLQGQRSDRRVMLMSAATGCSKSYCAAIEKRNDPAGVKIVELDYSMKNRPLQLLNAIIRGVGGEESTTASEAMETLIEVLNESPCAVIFEEAHEAGGSLLKIIKTLVNRTPSRFVIMAYPTLWARLLRQNDETFQEAQQLYGRVMKPIFDDYAKGTDVANIAYLLRRGLNLGNEAEDLARAMIEIVRKAGNLRLVADLVNEAQNEELNTDSEKTPGELLEMCRDLASKGGER